MPCAQRLSKTFRKGTWKLHRYLSWTGPVDLCYTRVDPLVSAVNTKAKSCGFWGGLPLLTCIFEYHYTDKHRMIAADLQFLYRVLPYCKGLRNVWVMAHNTKQTKRTTRTSLLRMQPISCSTETFQFSYRVPHDRTSPPTMEDMRYTSFVQEIFCVKGNPGTHRMTGVCASYSKDSGSGVRLNKTQKWIHK